jgi:hypothetical protein
MGGKWDKIVGAFSKIKKPISQFINEKINQDVRWYIMFFVVLATYFWLWYTGYKGINSDNEESKETALFLNPAAGGYNKVRGDLNSPSLFNISDPIEKAILGIIGGSGLLFLIYFIYYRHGENLLLTFMKWFIFWSHFALGVFIFAPLIGLQNPFHVRVLYNTRSLLAAIVNNPGKELYLAFIFIVIMPLPSTQKTTFRQRMTWLFLKLGLFFAFQTFLLGGPKYTIEPESDKNLLPDTRNEAYAVAIGVAILFIVWLFY